MSSRIRIVQGTMIALALVVLGTVTWLSVSSSGRADPDDLAQVTLGGAIYMEHCASCHGMNLEGQPDWREAKPNGRLPAPPHDVSGHTWHHPQDMLFEITKHGIAAFAPKGYETDMPSFGATLADEEIWADRDPITRRDDLPPKRRQL